MIADAQQVDTVSPYFFRFTSFSSFFFFFCCPPSCCRSSSSSLPFISLVFFSSPFYNFLLFLFFPLPVDCLSLSSSSASWPSRCCQEAGLLAATKTWMSELTMGRLLDNIALTMQRNHSVSAFVQTLHCRESSLVHWHDIPGKFEIVHCLLLPRLLMYCNSAQEGTFL